MTYGWPPVPRDGGWASANELLEGLGASPPRDVIVTTLRERARQAEPLRIAGADRLVRRRIGGFRPFQALLAALHASGVQARLGIDVFTWALLRGMKNIDLGLPVADDDRLPADHRWSTHARAAREAVTQYERLEDDGERPELPADAVSEAEHLVFRQVLLRRGARDELRVLAVLLLSGPSTPSEVSEDLGLSWHLGERVVAPFRAGGGRDVVEHVAATGSDGAEPIWRIRRGAIPWVLFALERRLGLDLSSMVEAP